MAFSCGQLFLLQFNCVSNSMFRKDIKREIGQSPIIVFDIVGTVNHYMIVACKFQSTGKRRVKAVTPCRNINRLGQLRFVKSF